MNHEKYLDCNRTAWNQKTAVHLSSAFYDVPGFKAGKTSLKEIELALIGDVKGKSILHLQCHFGQDTLSLARMGATVTGLDFSEEAIQAARQLAQDCNLQAAFVCSNVYDAPQALQQQYDMVFTTYGVLGWLPDMPLWARVVADCLKPGGRLVLVEFHPALWMFDNDFTNLQYSYFNQEAIVENESGTYTNRDADIATTTISWNHGLAEVLQSLIAAGLQIEDFRECDYSPYNCFNNTVCIAEGKWQIKGLECKLPMVYSVVGVKG